MNEEKFTYFWGGPFSQWLASNFEVQGVKYNCAEQYMMAMKAKTFNDEDTRRLIMEAENPKEQKALGRKVKNFNADVWNGVAKAYVFIGNCHKFTQNPDLLKTLMDTKGTTLVEASPYDKIWGIGLKADDPKVKSRDTWQGTNWLGEVLTDLRNNLEKN